MPSRVEILDALTASISNAKDLVGNIDETRSMAAWTARTGAEVVMSVPRIGLLRAIMLNHWYHPRGQLTVYLRELNVPLPSVDGPTADETPFG